MNAFENIIGYPAVKKELERIADILKGNEAYRNLGVKPPKGLILHGEPGLGKTLMATSLVRASGRPMFLCRKDRPDGDFVNAIKETFDEAKVNAPSIVFLDDVDKFANNDESRRDAEEYVTIQSCIDALVGADVFVLATANALRRLPRSLFRKGRFDRMIEIEHPTGDDIVQIMGHYLKNKKVSADLDAALIARLLKGNTCAMLESVINEAGIYAGFERCTEIQKKHFIRACMEMVYDVPADAFELHDKPETRLWKQVAYHEAGHAIVREILEPGSVTMAAIFQANSRYGGFCAFCADREKAGIEKEHRNMLGALGGRAAIELIMGICDAGSQRDLEKAFNSAEVLVKEHCIRGFHLHTGYEDSAELQFKQEQAVADEVERQYRKAKEILSANIDLLHRLAKELMDEAILDMYDIKRICSEARSEAPHSA